MTRLSKLLIAAATTAVIGGTAFADDPPAGEGGVGAEASGSAAVTTDPATAPAPVMDDSGATSAWTMEIIDRPLTLKKSLLRVEGNLGILKFAGATGVGLNVGAGYGISDKLELGASYGISLKSFEAKGPLTAYLLFDLAEGKLSAAVGAAFTYNLASESAGLTAGLSLRYKLTPKIAVFMPPTHLGIGLKPSPVSAVLNIPVGIALQATPNVYAFLQTNIASIGLKPSGHAIFGADFVPINVGAFYSPSNKMDIGVSFQTDIKNSPGDAFAILLTARLFTGSAVSTMSATPTTTAPAGSM